MLRFLDVSHRGRRSPLPRQISARERVTVRDQTPLEFLRDRKSEHELIEESIREQASDNWPIKILEAGCGRRWPFRLDGIDYQLTGVDLDGDALEIRKTTLADLHETIQGDLCTVDLPAGTYDVIYCSFVLEHIARADIVMKNFTKWIKPNGLIIIKVPDPESVHGYITRITPHWFHVFFYRFILGQKNAGKPGYGPYPTHYHPVISRSGMRNFCADRSNNVSLAFEYGDAYRSRKRSIRGTVIRLVMRLANILSLGRLSHRHSNLLYFLRAKQAPQSA